VEISAALLESAARELYSPVVSDVLDAHGLRGQVLSAGIRPLRDSHVAAGIAYTLQCVEISGNLAEPYAGLIAAVDGIHPDAVVMVSGHGSLRSAFWGELLTTAAQSAGARGVVVDGALRDARKILQSDFPAFCCGTIPLDASGRIEVIRHQCDVRMRDVVVHPGDMVFADLDGICVIPREQAAAILAEALDKAGQENKVRDGLRRGMKLSEAFAMYHVL
jgi:4-hydroxy-4-methyl-2-oxoglutarate aldolase